MKIRRLYTEQNENVFQMFEYKFVDVQIKNDNGDVVETMEKCEFPESWSENACTICATKYFRKTGVPTTGRETSIKEVVQRLANCWLQWGIRNKYFDSNEDARAFYDEMLYLLLSQTIAPNSPQWFNTGLFESYGIKGKKSGYYYYDGRKKRTFESEGTYDRIPANACYILNIEDNLLGTEGIMDSIKTETKIFKFGSGCGSNFSKLRSSKENLESGGTSSGLMSFLKVYDANAGVIKSGGYTRRSAKMVIVDENHPEVLDFIDWKVKEEAKAKALINAGYSDHYEGEAYKTVSGQQSNNSIALRDSSMEAARFELDTKIQLTKRTNPAHVYEEVPAKDMLMKIAEATWACGDPGVIFIDRCNRYNTMARVGEIRATNPCAEFIHIDNTACNLASINLIKFLVRDEVNGGYKFDFERFEHVVELLTVMLDITVTMSHYPTETIAYNSFHSRPLGIGFANMGALLIRLLIPYGSLQGCLISSYISSIMTFAAYNTSAKMAADRSLGISEFCDYNRSVINRIIEKHCDSLFMLRNLSIAVEKDDEDTIFINKLNSSVKNIILEGRLRSGVLSNLCSENARKNGVRNSQVTAIAPTGTIAIVMDCDTTGIEPPFSLVTHKLLSGGGTMKLIVKSVEDALRDIFADDEAKFLEAKAWLEENGNLAEFAHLTDDEKKVFRSAVSDNESDVIAPFEHITMAGRSQYFISGGISKTINCPNSTTVDDIYKLYIEAYVEGMKAVSIYRDGCKASQPLSADSRECKTCGTGEICELYE